MQYFDIRSVQINAVNDNTCFGVILITFLSFHLFIKKKNCMIEELND